jgi:hypothetical protein
MSVPQPVTPPPAPELGLRIVYMILFAMVFWILCWVLVLVTIAQLVLRLINGRPQPELAQFGAGMGRYARALIGFLTFGTDVVPYPFSPWPVDA